MAIVGVYLKEIELVSNTPITIQPYNCGIGHGSGFSEIKIKDGSFQITDKHVMEILKKFEKDELQEIFKKLKEGDYI